MSLLDALQAAGAIDKKAAAKAKREAKLARKKQQGSRDKKKVIEAKADEDQQEARRVQRERKQAERLARQAQGREEDAKVTSANLIRAWSISFSCAFATSTFTFESNLGDTETVSLPDFLIGRVRSGALGLARIGTNGEIAVLPKGAMAKLDQADPSAVLYLANGP